MCFGFKTEQHIENLKDLSKALMIDLPFDFDISPFPPQIFTEGVKNCNIWPNFDIWGVAVSNLSDISKNSNQYC